MADQVTFVAQRREVFGKAVRRLRRQGMIPANIYGHGKLSQAVQLDEHDFTRALATHPATTIWRLTLGAGAEEAVVVRHMQHEPRTGAIQHVDFLHVEMSEPIRARIPVHLQGEAPAVRAGDGILLPLLDTIEVEALPGDLPATLLLDVSGLTELNQALHVGDVAMPARVAALTDPGEMVVKIERARAPISEEISGETTATEAPAEAATEAASE